MCKAWGPMSQLPGAWFSIHSSPWGKKQRKAVWASAHEQRYSNPSSLNSEGGEEGTWASMQGVRETSISCKTVPKMVGNEGPNYILPLVMTLGHHASAIIYSGKVIRELGPGNWYMLGWRHMGVPKMRVAVGKMLLLHLPPPNWGHHKCHLGSYALSLTCGL